MPDTIQTQSIPVEKIKSSPHQARKNFDEQSVQALAANLKDRGLINPISVRLLADGTWELIAGERRFRAVKLLGWPEIDARVFPNVTDLDASLMGLIENLQRTDLNPMEEANGYALLKASGLDQGQIADKVGKERTVILRSLALLDLPEEVKANVARATLSPGHCRHIAKIADKTKQIKISEQAADEGWSVRQTEEAVNKALGKPPKGDGKGQKAPKSGEEPENPNLNDPIEPVWNKMFDLHIPDHQGIFDLGIDYKGKYKWVFSTEPNWGRDQKDPPDTSAPALAQGIAQALRELSDAYLKAAGPVVKKMNSDGDQQAGKQPPAVQPMEVQENRAPSQSTPSSPQSVGPIIAQRPPVPVPKLKEAQYVAGNKLQLKWADLGEGFTYCLFRSFETDYPKYMPLAGETTVSTAGAIINVRPEINETSQMIAVMGIDPQGQESELSEGVRFDLKPWNTQDSVSPLPTAPGAPASASVAPEPIPVTQAKKPLDPRIAALVAEHADKEALI